MRGQTQAKPAMIAVPAMNRVDGSGTPAVSNPRVEIVHFSSLVSGSGDSTVRLWDAFRSYAASRRGTRRKAEARRFVERCFSKAAASSA